MRFLLMDDGSHIPRMRRENLRFVRAFPDKGMKWRVSNTGGVNPVWSRDGRELFYRTEEQEIMVVSYTVNGDSFRAAKPRQWSQQKQAIMCHIRPDPHC